MSQSWDGQSCFVTNCDQRRTAYIRGRPAAAGSRFRTVNDFGFVSLDVLSAYPEDSGTYTVRATNRLGKATSQLNINVKREWRCQRALLK